jgi:hypothetical protein
MTENKLYAQCRKQALEQYFEKQGTNNEIEVCKLTAELYAMKLLDMLHPNDKTIILKGNHIWFELVTLSAIGTTKQLHDMFVQEFNNEEGK